MEEEESETITFVFSLINLAMPAYMRPGFSGADAVTLIMVAVIFVWAWVKRNK